MAKFTKMKRIAVDCRMLKKSGIGVYLSNLLFYWLQKPDIQWLLIGNRGELNELPLTSNCRILQCNIPIFSYRELIGFPTKEINKCDIFFSPNFNVPFGIRIPIYFTVHDVVFLDYKDFDKQIGVLIRRIILSLAIKRAKTLFTVSNFSKERIEAYFGKKKEIMVAYNGLSNELLSFELNSKPTVYDFNYLVFVGNIKKHKGLDILLSAMEGEGRKLVVVGDVSGLKTADQESIKKMRLNENVILAGRIEDNATLFSLIHQADALIQPSRYEGFGIPPLEAMALGTPVIISDIKVFKEIYNELPVVFFKDGDVTDLRNMIKNNKFPVINSDIVRQKYTYKASAEIILHKLLNSY